MALFILNAALAIDSPVSGLEHRGLLESGDMLPTNTTGETEEIQQESRGLAVLTMMLLLGVALVVGQILEKNRIDWMSEAGGALIIGVIVGLTVNLVNNITPDYENLFKFNTDFFFIFLLPPIIFDAAFNLEVAPCVPPGPLQCLTSWLAFRFYKNTGAICMLAFVGTAISTVVIAVMMWLLGVMRLSYRIDFFHSTLFGAIISATDPVTVISSFASNPVTFGGVFMGLWKFVYIFVGSLVIGLAVACVAAVLFRTQYFRNEHAPVEAGLVIILAYSSFYIPYGIGLSGIVSIMFCGMVMAKYVRPNLSRSTDDRVGAFFRVIASLAEIFVFVYIGCALFTEKQAWDKFSTWMFMFWSLAALAVSRYLNVYPSTAFINMLRPPEHNIPDNHKHMLWFSGLRGAMAFALAMLANSEFNNESSQVVLTSTFFMILITVLFNGGASTYMLSYWDLFDSRDCMSPEPGHSLAVLVPQTSNDLDGNGAPGAQHHQPSTTGSTVIDSIHDFQRQGGLNRQFAHLDKVFSNYLVASTEEQSTNRNGSEQQYDSAPEQ